MTEFEAYSYRTSSRFGSRVWVTVDDGTVTVTGPRVGLWAYRLWIAGQVVLFWLIPPVLVAAVAFWDWRILALVVVLGIVYWVFSGTGAVALWEYANVTDFINGTWGATTSFPASAVRRVRIGTGWARGILWLVIPLVIPGINQMARGVCVSFEAPAGDAGGDVVYALHMHTPEDAQALARFLEGSEI